MVDTLRGLVTAAVPDVVEDREWRTPTSPDGVPTFSCDGPVCTVETYRDEVKVTLARGAALDAPAGVFDARLDAGTRRAVDLRRDDTLDEAAFASLVRAAVALDRADQRSGGPGRAGPAPASGRPGSRHT